MNCALYKFRWPIWKITRKFNLCIESILLKSKRICVYSPNFYPSNLNFQHQYFASNFVSIFEFSNFRDFVWINEFANHKIRPNFEIEWSFKGMAKKIVIHCISQFSTKITWRHDNINELMQNSERKRDRASFDVQSIKLPPIFGSSSFSKYHIDQTEYTKYFTLLLHCVHHSQSYHHFGCRMRQLFFIIMSTFQLAL